MSFSQIYWPESFSCCESTPTWSIVSSLFSWFIFTFFPHFFKGPMISKVPGVQSFCDLQRWDNPFQHGFCELIQSHNNLFRWFYGVNTLQNCFCFSQCILENHLPKDRQYHIQTDTSLWGYHHNHLSIIIREKIIDRVVVDFSEVIAE